MNIHKYSCMFYNYYISLYCVIFHTVLVYSGGSRWVSGVTTETLFRILKKPFSLQFIFNVHGLSYINSKYPDYIVT